MLGSNETAGQSQGISFDFRIGEIPALNRVAGPVESTLGFSADSFRSGDSDFFDQVHPDDEDIVRQLLSPEPTRGPRSVHLRLLDAEDRVAIFACHYERLHEDAGTKLKLILFKATQVSEPVDDATMLHYFDELMKNTRDVVYIKDTHHVITAASTSLLEYVDSANRVEDLVGRTDYEIHPREQADRYHSLEKRVFKENRYLGDIQEAVTADGRSRWVDNRKVPLHDAEGEIIGVFGFVRDVTSEILLERELKTSERRNRLFFELVSSLHVIIDLNGRFVDVNNGWSEVLGYEREEIVGNYIPDFLHPDDAAGTLKEIERLARGVTTLHFRNRYRHKSGHYRLIDWSAEYDPAEQLIYAAGNDITDLEATRGRLEDLVRIRTDALEKAQQEAVQANQARSRFLVNMGEEIRTPVNDMVDMLDRLKKTGRDSGQNEYIEKARYSAKVLSEIINDILDLSRIESGEAESDTQHSGLAHSASDTNEADPGEAFEQQGDDSLQRLRGASVLLVEDDVINQQFARELMAREELKVEVAGNGEEALDILATRSFDLILMDCRMPVMDGYEATRRIRANPALDETPVLALTANATKQDITRALDAGMDDHIAKPIVPAVMFNTMARWLARGRKVV